jgi:uncharacterized membrane protein
MNKTIQTILIVVGLVLIAFGIYKMIMPEASIDIGIAKVEAQDNNDAYITIGLGLAALVLGYIGGKK